MENKLFTKYYFIVFIQIIGNFFCFNQSLITFQLNLKFEILLRNSKYIFYLYSKFQINNFYTIFK